MKKETQLYAMIKKSSRHYNQQSYHLDDDGKATPFEITISEQNDSSREGEAKGGVGGNYYLKELDIYVMVNYEFVRLN